jgi:hypothetical protein
VTVLVDAPPDAAAVVEVGPEVVVGADPVVVVELADGPGREVVGEAGAGGRVVVVVAGFGGAFVAVVTPTTTLVGVGVRTLR